MYIWKLDELGYSQADVICPHGKAVEVINLRDYSLPDSAQQPEVTLWDLVEYLATSTKDLAEHCRSHTPGVLYGDQVYANLETAEAVACTVQNAPYGFSELLADDYDTLKPIIRHYFSMNPRVMPYEESTLGETLEEFGLVAAGKVNLDWWTEYP